MNFFAVLIALLIEQVRPLPRVNRVHGMADAWVRWAGRSFDAGRPSHAWVAWGVAVIVPSVAVALVSVLLAGISSLLAFAWTVGVLYLTLGFRQFSYHFTNIREALLAGDEARARELLARWRPIDSAELPRSELLRLVIETALLAAHRHVFGVFFVFIVFSTLGLGPAGAVFYRLSAFVPRVWASSQGQDTTTEVARDERVERAQRIFSGVDHVPARMTAFGFAVVGNFEEAVEAWQRDADLWPQLNDGIILSAAAGALGVQLGGGLPGAPSPAGPGSTLGAADASDPARAADADTAAAQAAGRTPGLPPHSGHLRSVVGLVWRSVALWLLLLALLSLANLIG